MPATPTAWTRPPAWSKSSLGSVLTGCSWQYYLAKLGLIPPDGSPYTALGLAYHAGIEYHERWRVRRNRTKTSLIELPRKGEVEWVAEGVLAERWDRISDDMLRKHDMDYHDARRLLSNALTNWWEELRPVVVEWRPIAVEPHVLVAPFEDTSPIHGFLDVLYWDPEPGLGGAGQWVVVDNKTARDWRYWPHDGAGHELEGLVYTAAATLSSRLPAMGSVRMEWHIARREISDHYRFQGTRRVARTFSAEDVDWMEWLKEQIRRADDIVDKGLYAKNTDWSLCSAKWCPAYQRCEVTGEWTPDRLRQAGTGFRNMAEARRQLEATSGNQEEE